MKIATYWKVTTKFYDSGKVRAEICSFTNDHLPVNYYKNNGEFVVYVDYFDNEQQARKFYQIFKFIDTLKT